MKFPISLTTLLPFFLGLSLVSGFRPNPNLGANDQKPILASDLDIEDSQNMPPTTQNSDDVPIVSDLLSIQRDVSIFADFVRGSELVMKRLNDAGINTTVLAPLNSAVKALPRKPWEDPESGNNVKGSFAGLDGEKRAADNLERFVKAHMIPVSPFNENEKVETLEGRTIWWSTENGITKIFPDGIEVKEVKNAAPNGQIWTLTGVVNYSSE